MVSDVTADDCLTPHRVLCYLRFRLNLKLDPVSSCLSSVLTQFKGIDRGPNLKVTLPSH